MPSETGQITLPWYSGSTRARFSGALRRPYHPDSPATPLGRKALRRRSGCGFWRRFDPRPGSPREPNRKRLCFRVHTFAVNYPSSTRLSTVTLRQITVWSCDYFWHHRCCYWLISRNFCLLLGWSRSPETRTVGYGRITRFRRLMYEASSCLGSVGSGVANRSIGHQQR